MKVYCQNVWNYNPSEYRNGLLASLVEEFDGDVCLFQECGPTTIRVGGAPLPELLKGTYTEVCPEVSDRNFTPVFYKTEKFSVIDSGYVVYDGLNDYNSKSVTWAVLEDKTSGKRVAMLSTHFWWMARSEEDNRQRLQNVEQLKGVCDAIREKYDVPVIVGGDLNNGTNAEQGDEPYRYMLTQGFTDVRDRAPVSTDLLTHHDYPVKTEDDRYESGGMPVRTLDYLFTYGEKKCEPVCFEILTTEKALSSSDHCPLLGKFEV